MPPAGWVARETDGTHAQIVKIHPSSCLADKKVPAIVYDELVRA